MPSRNTRDSRASHASKSLWDYLNSPLGIWFLSSVLFASVTFFATWFHAALQNRRLKEEKRLALSEEIYKRYTDFFKQCQGAKSYPYYVCYRKLWEDFAILTEPQHKLFQFKDASMDELVYEMKSLDPARGNQIDEAFGETEDTLEEFYPNTPDQLKGLYSKLDEIVNKGVKGALTAGGSPQSNPDKRKD